MGGSEELHQIGRFVLINREDMVKALEAPKLKVAGLVEEGDRRSSVNG